MRIVREEQKGRERAAYGEETLIRLADTVRQIAAQLVALHFSMDIDNTDTRRFYELEALEQGWTLRELRRRFDSGLYEQLALSREKKRVKKLSEEGAHIPRRRIFPIRTP